LARGHFRRILELYSALADAGAEQQSLQEELKTSHAALAALLGKMQEELSRN